MRSNAYVRVTCDECEVEMEMDLTATAGKGSWDERSLDRQLRRDGWSTEGDQDLCDECSPPAHGDNP